MANTKEAFPSQSFIKVKEIKNGTVILDNGSLRQILLVSGINFDLKSEEEQGMIIGSFQNLFNGLNFSIQIFVHSRKLNIESYLEKLDVREIQESNELLKNQISEYKEFVRAFVSENAIMNKTYFVVIPYDPIQLPQAGEDITKKVFEFLQKRGIAKPTERLEDKRSEAQFQTHVEQLNQRVDQVVNSLDQIGLRAISLNDDELTDLFFNLYNPETIERSTTQRMT
jgi:type IV secretory pathway VirB4 component